VAAVLSLKNISIAFGGVLAVDDLSLDIRSGAITGLIGPNGAGKTTAFNIMAGSLRPDSGQVLFDGRPITALAPHQRAAPGIARTFQLAHEFTRLTVIENLMVAADIHAGENVFNTVFRRGRFAHAVDRSPACGVRAERLRGRWQRAAPQNLLEAMVVAADEPGSGIDDAQVAGNVLTMLLAGEDTTANTLAWCIWLLKEHPAALERAQAVMRRRAFITATTGLAGELPRIAGAQSAGRVYRLGILDLGSAPTDLLGPYAITLLLRADEVIE